MEYNHVHVIKALRFAISAHEWDIDKAGLPTIFHPLQVFNYVQPHESIIVQILALLHDTVEDTNIPLSMVEDKFGKEIKEGVDALTRRQKENYYDYLDRCALHKEACIVKYHDIRHNLLRCWANPEEFKSLQTRYEKAIEVVNCALDDHNELKF